MSGRDGKLRLLATLLGLLCMVAFVGCSTGAGGGGGGGGGGDNDNGGGGGGDNDNDNFVPAGVTFGAVQPDRDTVEARPQAINPFAASATVELPSSADLTREVPPIGNQGNLGSCTAWASGYAGATYTANRQYGWGATSADHQASPGYLYNVLIATDSLPCGSGTYITTAMNHLVQTGCSSLQLVEYSDSQCLEGPSGSDAANFRIGSFNRVVETDRYALRGELAAGRVLVIGARLYDDFPNATGGDVYRGSGNFLTQGSQDAAHAMSVVGYDDQRQAYRIMNSWSAQWGDAGFLWMAYDTFDATVFEAYSIEAAGDREPPTPPGPGPGPEPDEEDPEGYLDEAYQFADSDPETREELVYLVFFYHFSAPVYIRTVTVTDPTGDEGHQTYETWFRDGYVYFVQTGGFQWEAGVYTLDFDVQTKHGNDLIYTGEANIEPLDGGDGGEGLCSDICIFAYDGECDDGGEDAFYELCDYGTDCFDCGVREDGGGGDGEICIDTCRFAGDGECDDGGPDAMYAACEYGTDCADCGSREPSDDTEVCFDSCPYAYDGECDDGGSDSAYDVCEFGSDCSDCGPRSADDIDDGGDETLLCEDTCTYAGDGECDDGGPDAAYDECEYGTDCADCGPRELDGGARVQRSQKPTRTFRGIPVMTPTWAHGLPPAGVREGVLGANRKPAVVVPAEPK